MNAILTWWSGWYEYLVTTWSDTGPAWIGAVGGLLGAAASIYAIVIAVGAAREHASWIKVVARSSSKNTPTGYEIVNGSKKTEAVVDSITDVTGDSIDALDTFTELPMIVAPGMSFPIGISRSLANSYPTVVEIRWRERAVDRRRVGRKVRMVRMYL